MDRHPCGIGSAMNDPSMCPRGQVLGLEDSSRTECRGLGLCHQVIGLGLGRQVLGLGPEPLALEAWLSKSSITTFSFGLSYCLHFSVNELMTVQIIVVGLVFSV